MTLYNVIIKKPDQQGRVVTKDVESDKIELLNILPIAVGKKQFYRNLIDNIFNNDTVPRNLFFNRTDSFSMSDTTQRNYIGGTVTRQDALTHWWKFNEEVNTGTNDPRTPVDSQTEYPESWDLNNVWYGNRVPIIATPGKEGNYYKLNAYMCYYNYFPIYAGTRPYSCSFWVRAPSPTWYSGQAKIFMDLRHLGAGNFVGVTTGAKVNVYFNLAGGGGISPSSPTIADTDWHLCCWTVDESFNTFFYWDNVLRWSSTSVWSDGGTQEIKLGWTFSYAQMEQMGIDDLRFYNIALSPDEADAIWNDGYGDYPGVLGAWSYYKTITIDNTGNPNQLNDYQVLLTVNTQELISAGKMKADGSDIEFTAGSSIFLHYYLEGPIDDVATKIWVKVPTIAASSLTEIKMYYGNPSAPTPVSNGFKTFDYYEDWTTGTPSSRWQMLNGSFNVVYDSDIGENCIRLIGSNTTMISKTLRDDWAQRGFIYSMKIKWQTFGYYGPRIAHGLWRQSDTKSVLYGYWERGGGGNAAQLQGNGFSIAYNYDDWILGQVYPIIMRRKQNELWVSKNGSTMWFNNTAGSATETSPFTFRLSAWNTNQDVRVGKLIVRKLADPEPSTIIGPEA